MKVKILGSTSEGNCYLFQSGEETLIVECGVRFADIKKGLGFDLSKVVGCFVTHLHRDHSRSLPDVLKFGIKTFAHKSVFESFEISTRAFCNEIEPMKGYKVGNFKILTLPAFHDVPCMSFVIDHPDMGKTLFATDTMMLQHKVKGLRHIFIECNYCDEILDKNIEEGVVLSSMRARLLQTHMELKTTVKTLKANDLSDVNEVVLLHLSNHNSDGYHFQEEVKKATGKEVVIARAGVEIELNTKPF